MIGVQSFCLINLSNQESSDEFSSSFKRVEKKDESL